MSARPKHELEQVADALAKEVDPKGNSMRQLADYVWHGAPPFAQKVSKDEAESMFETLLRSPAGILTLNQKFGHYKVRQIQEELVRQGKLSASILGGQASGQPE